MLKWENAGENWKVLLSKHHVNQKSGGKMKHKIIIADELVSVIVSDYIAPYTVWRNRLTVLELERKLKEIEYPKQQNTKAPLLPWYMGFSHFERDNEWLVFKAFPLYYIKSWRIRLTQLRQRFGRFIQNIGNRIAQ